jgi:hypothetical protein
MFFHSVSSSHFSPCLAQTLRDEGEAVSLFALHFRAACEARPAVGKVIRHIRPTVHPQSLGEPFQRHFGFTPHGP